jgi:predicted secreted protein
MTGKDIIVILSQNGTAMASTRIKSQDIKVDADMIEKASATQQEWKEYVAGRKGWQMSISYLVLTSTKILDLLLAGCTFTVTMREAGTQTSGVTGTALLRSVGQVFTVGSLAQGNFSLLGSGPLTQG